MIDDRPVFIAGLDRTGKTPMRIAIEERASIAIARRAELWTHHVGRYGSLADDGRARAAVDALLNDAHVAALLDDADALLEDLLKGPRTYAHLFAIIGRQHARRSGRRRWGDQTALLERRAPEILEAFTAAVIVHMIRDPRDRYAASARAGGVGRGGVGRAIEEWLESVSLAERHATRWPDRYLIVRFEDLAVDPEKTLRDVMEAIGEPSSRTASVVVAPELATGIGLHAQLARRTIALIERRCGEEMARHRYEAAAPTLSVSDWLRVALLDRPTSAATGFVHRRRAAATRRQSERAVIGR